MVEKPGRARLLIVFFLGVMSIASWVIIYFHDPVAKGRGTAGVGIAVTIVMMFVLMRGQAMKGGVAAAAVVLSLISLVLGMIAMIVMTF